MTAALVAIVLGTLTFESQEVPGVVVSSVLSLSGEPDVNYAHADLNGDGKADLLLGDAVWFQQEGGYPPSARYGLPPVDGPALVQAWTDTLFMWTAEELSRYQWGDGNWVLQTSQPLPRPDGISQDVAPGNVANPHQVFLHDFDGDSSPEIFRIAPDGVHLYDGQEDVYERVRLLKILPGMQLAQHALDPIWPPEERRITFPVLEMTCRVVIDGGDVCVVTREEAGGAKVSYRRLRYGWDAAEASSEPSAVTRPVPQYLHPCRLNGDRILDLAGGHWRTSGASVLPLPVYETWASLNGGETFHVRRSASLPLFRPKCSFVDFDGDGLHDMVTEETGLFDGGLRETVSRVLTLPEVRHTVSVYRQQADGFEEHPGYRSAFTIHLESAPLAQGIMLQRYRAGELVDATGDFDGDGVHDLAIRDRVDRVSIHLTGGGGFTGTADATLKVDRAARFAAADVNGDGRGDVVLRKEGEAATVYYSRGGEP